jgi:hypothetical protein
MSCRDYSVKTRRGTFKNREFNISSLKRLLSISHIGNIDACQSAIEETLTPMVRVALRRGLGAATLVNWVRDADRNIAMPLEESSVESRAAMICRWLASELLRGRNGDSTRLEFGMQTQHSY